MTRQFKLVPHMYSWSKTGLNVWICYSILKNDKTEAARGTVVFAPTFHILLWQSVSPTLPSFSPGNGTPWACCLLVFEAVRVGSGISAYTWTTVWTYIYVQCVNTHTHRRTIADNSHITLWPALVIERSFYAPGFNKAQSNSNRPPRITFANVCVLSFAQRRKSR